MVLDLRLAWDHAPRGGPSPTSISAAAANPSSMSPASSVNRPRRYTLILKTIHFSSSRFVLTSAPYWLNKWYVYSDRP